MLNDGTSDVTTRPWWDRALDSIIDVVEDRVLDPIDLHVTPHIERHQARVAHRRVSTARHTLETRTVRAWPFGHDARARLLHAWAGLESAAVHTRRGLHEATHNGRLDDSNGCCTALIRLYTDRAELLRALAIVEEQTTPLPGREPNFGAMPTRLRRLGESQFAELARTPGCTARAPVAEQLCDRLQPEIGAAVDPIRRIYVG